MKTILFIIWKMRVRRAMRKIGFGEVWIKTVDWGSMKEGYFDKEYTPEETVEEEISYGT